MNDDEIVPVLVVPTSEECDLCTKGAAYCIEQAEKLSLLALCGLCNLHFELWLAAASHD